MKQYLSQTEPRRALREYEAAQRYAMGLGTLRGKRNPKSLSYDPTFPLPVRLGKNTIAYIEAELDEWLATRERVTTRGVA